MELQLESRVWEVGQRLDADTGGFGAVFEATSDDGGSVVVKYVKKAPGAERELLFGDALKAAPLRNVVPILDKGEAGDFLVLVMPRAEKSLAQHMAALAGERMDPSEALDALTDVAEALVALEEAGIVHRDLKPANVLFLEGKWCIADFGISRYAEATTAVDTRKYSKTPAYAAPEQWNEERATSATDVYAFGVMAYEITAGHRPFLGPEVHDFREQHRTATPERLLLGTNRLRNIVEECLSKVPAQRPAPANLLARLQKAREEPTSQAASRLAAQNLRIVQERTQASAEAEAIRQATEQRARLAADGIRAFNVFAEPLLQQIEDDAPAATIKRGDGQGRMVFVADLDGAELGVAAPVASQNWTGPFDVVAHASISVHPKERYGVWVGRSHSLWFCDAFEQGRFAWYELAFMDSPLVGSQRPIAPDSREPREASVAFSNVVGTMQLAWTPGELDRDEPDEFIERWIGWFADAVEGKLVRPSTMPERPDDGQWRHS
ncbi:serine/threonine-protein kinase [Promicromonospora sp. NPDC019610]|uniref:serine/threonine-protein kinase n=1 Tax=Promicromonospora sp. NPDC019610 TaxID=3364405 RepID=UPI0037B82263